MEQTVQVRSNICGGIAGRTQNAVSCLCSTHAACASWCRRLAPCRELLMLLLLHAARLHAWASLSSLHHIHCRRQLPHVLLHPACLHP